MSNLWRRAEEPVAESGGVTEEIPDGDGPFGLVGASLPLAVAGDHLHLGVVPLGQVARHFPVKADLALLCGKYCNVTSRLLSQNIEWFLDHL